MPAPTQANRPMAVSTPLGQDKLLLTGLTGTEGISQLFTFQLDCVAEVKTDVAFDKLLGQLVSVRLELANKQQRYFCGICNRVGQGESDAEFTNFRLEMVPPIWLLTRKAQSRIFQYETVPQILQKVFAGFSVDWQLKGTYQPRDFCVQYRETDFNFASRTMEEEGIYYFFKHTDKGCQMVVADTPAAHADVPSIAKITYKNVSQAVAQKEDFIYDWGKTQELASGKVTLWDHCFELPHKHLEAEKQIQDTVQVGQAAHKLKVSDNGKLELYDWPGEYAQRFDGINRGGGEQPAEVQKIFQDNARTTAIRMEEQAAGSIVVEGASNCRQLVSGHKFTLATVPNDPLVKQLKPDGKYVLTGVSHSARFDGYRSSGSTEFEYHNNFTCIPDGLPFRPQRVTPKPLVPGSQTAVVVGPAGEEIFCDKYGRIKVQFHWDREGKNDANSSCWLRVGTPWAGKQWGMIHIPRIGQEVIVDFLEGDPDQPIVVGSVYNADQMPPYKLPDNRTQSGLKSRSSLKGTPDNFNEFRFEDKKGEELVYLHAEKNQDIVVENDEQHSVGHDRKKSIKNDETSTIGNDRTETVGSSETIQIGKERTERVGKNETVNIGENRTHSIGKDEAVNIGANKTDAIAKNLTISVGANQSLTVKKSQSEDVGGSRTVKITENDSLDVGKELMIVAGDQIVLKTGQASITMKKNGDILIEGKNITIKGSGKINAEASSDVTIKGSKVKHN